MRLALIGDVHLRFDARDVAALDARGYDAVLFAGDLAGYAPKGGLTVARAIAELRTPALVIPGNHDAATAPQLVAEMMQNDAAAALLAVGMERRVAKLRAALGPAVLAGYSRHPLVARDGTRIDCIAARPHSFGGPHLAFRTYLRAAFGIDSMAASEARLCALVDETESDAVVFLAHNGPSGLGEHRESIWGVDFRRSEGDHGDPDLRAAIEHARARGKAVLGVFAGHMHHALRGGGNRAWQAREGDTLFVNAARVPRIFRAGERKLRHWIELELGARAEAREVLQDA